MTAERRQPKTRAEGVIRPYTPRDRAAVREICCRTAFRNMGCEKLFEDRELHADYWSSYYTDHAPQNVLVIEQDGEVIGYFFGLTDHTDFHRVMARRIVPRTLLRALGRALLRRYEKPETYRYLRFALFHAWREEPKVDYAAYPATYHFNVLRKGYGRGYYTRLVLGFLDRLDELGIRGIHGHITEPAGRGIWHRFDQMFTEERPQDFDEKPCTLFARVLGDEREMVNRAWAVRVEDYRKWILWLRETQRL
jgi:hypothetical protein